MYPFIYLQSLRSSLLHHANTCLLSGVHVQPANPSLAQPQTCNSDIDLNYIALISFGLILIARVDL